MVCIRFTFKTGCDNGHHLQEKDHLQPRSYFLLWDHLMRSGCRGNSTSHSDSTQEGILLENATGSCSETVSRAPANNMTGHGPAQVWAQKSVEGRSQPTTASPTRQTPLSTSPTKEWTRITRQREMDILYQGRKTQWAIIPTPPPSKEDEKKHTAAPAPFFPDILFIQGRLESSPISDDEPTMLEEEPPQRDARRQRNRRRNVRRHHEAGERDPVQPASWDEALEMGETPAKEHIENGASPVVVTAVKLRNASGS
jgi:hypothetical protein